MKYILLIFCFIFLCCKGNIKDSTQIKITKDSIEYFTIDSIERKYIGAKIINKREELISELKLALEREHDRPRDFSFFGKNNIDYLYLLQFYNYKDFVINNVTYKAFYFDTIAS